MNLFNKFKNNDEKFISLQNFYDGIGSLLKQDIFISKKNYMGYVNSSKEAYETLKVLKENNTLVPWCKNTKSDIKEIEKFMGCYEVIEVSIKKHNDAFISKHLIQDKEYLDKILEDDDKNIILDEDQRKVILNDEDYTLVIAGAGAGKTTTLEAKAKYLVEKLHINPSRILVISFTKKATGELQDRFKKLESQLKFLLSIPLEIL